MAATIGIKIANGGFYSIIEENSAVKKRLILTTVHDNQRSVQIDLYKTFTKTMADALYIGSLVVEKIKPQPKGEPSIEMIITSTPEGEITADAIDLDTISGGEHHYLNVSLKSLDEDNRESEIPDFELEQHEGPPSGLYTGSARARKKEGAFPWLPVILVGLIIIIALLAVWFFALRGSPLSLSETGGSTAQSRPAAPPEPAPAPSPPPAQPAEPPAQTAAPVQPAAPPPVIKAPEAPPARTPAAGRNRPPAPVSSYQTPATIPRDGAPYRIRWGDTLWDISEAFYRNPWLYPRIARFNNIKNPDLIVSGTTIRIPPKN
jgi:LysM repeat protein